VLESHPELVFTALAGRPLGRTFQKRTLQGVLMRNGLLRKRGIALETTVPIDGVSVAAQDVLDAGAMALVALAWAHNGNDIRVIRGEAGDPEPLRRQPQREWLMALPEDPADSRGKRALRAG